MTAGFIGRDQSLDTPLRFMDRTASKCRSTRASQVTDLSSRVCRLTILPWSIREPGGKVVQSLLFFGVRLVWVEIILTGTALAKTFLAGIDGSFELQVKLDQISWTSLFLRCRSEVE